MSRANLEALPPDVLDLLGRELSARDRLKLESSTELRRRAISRGKSSSRRLDREADAKRAWFEEIASHPWSFATYAFGYEYARNLIRNSGTLSAAVGVAAENNFDLALRDIISRLPSPEQYAARYGEKGPLYESLERYFSKRGYEAEILLQLLPLVEEYGFEHSLRETLSKLLYRILLHPEPEEEQAELLEELLAIGTVVPSTSDLIGAINTRKSLDTIRRLLNKAPGDLPMDAVFYNASYTTPRARALEIMSELFRRGFQPTDANTVRNLAKRYPELASELPYVPPVRQERRRKSREFLP